MRCTPTYKTATNPGGQNPASVSNVRVRGGCTYPRRKNLWLIIWYGLSVWSILFAATPLMANQKVGLLQQKIADLQLLDSELERHISQAEALKTKLVEQRRFLEQELVDLNRLLKLRSLQEAFQKPRFKYDLKLIVTLDAYIEALVKKIDFYQLGRDKVAFLLQLAEDDIRMLSALSDLRIEALTTQISLLINRYLPEAHAIVITPDDLQYSSPQAIWQKITSKRAG